jgi:hypothetical protein
MSYDAPCSPPGLDFLDDHLKHSIYRVVFLMENPDVPLFSDPPTNQYDSMAMLSKS